MTTRLIWLSCYLLLSLGIADADPQRSRGSAPRDLKEGMKEGKMKKWRYSEAGQAAKETSSSKGKSSSSSSSSSSKGKGSKGKGSSSSTKGGLMMMMKMMMYGKGKGKGNTPPDKPIPTPAPTRTNYPAESPTAMPTVEVDDADYERCLILLASADVDADDWLDEQEYVRFINRWSGVTYVGELFEDLDPALQRNFVFLAQGQEEGIDVTGSKPNQAVPDDSHLRRYCSYTFTLLESDDVVITTRAPSPASELLLSECFLAMVISDADFNSQMDQTEYVTFIDRFTEEEIEAETFDDLDIVLQENFFQFASEGYIDITGARPDETPTDELVSVCTSTQAAVNVVLEDS